MPKTQLQTSLFFFFLRWRDEHYQYLYESERECDAAMENLGMYFKLGLYVETFGCLHFNQKAKRYALTLQALRTYSAYTIIKEDLSTELHKSNLT